MNESAELTQGVLYFLLLSASLWLHLPLARPFLLAYSFLQETFECLSAPEGVCRYGARRPAGQLQICEPGWPGKGPTGVRPRGILAILDI